MTRSWREFTSERLIGGTPGATLICVAGLPARKARTPGGKMAGSLLSTQLKSRLLPCELLLLEPQASWATISFAIWPKPATHSAAGIGQVAIGVAWSPV